MLYVIQIIWYKFIFINQLQQYKNKIVVQFSSYYGHMDASASVNQLTTRS